MGDARDAEVQHPRLRAADHEDVGRLDVAVHHALAVCIGERVGDAAHDQRGLRRRGRASLPGAAGAGRGPSAAPSRCRRVVVADAGVEHRDDVRVDRPGGGARLVQEHRVEGRALLGRSSRFSVLIAIRRDSSGSCAAYTVPRPPSPSGTSARSGRCGRWSASGSPGSCSLRRPWRSGSFGVVPAPRCRSRPTAPASGGRRGTARVRCPAEARTGVGGIGMVTPAA